MLQANLRKREWLQFLAAAQYDVRLPFVEDCEESRPALLFLSPAVVCSSIRACPPSDGMGQAGELLKYITNQAAGCSKNTSLLGRTLRRPSRRDVSGGNKVSSINTGLPALTILKNRPSPSIVMTDSSSSILRHLHIQIGTMLLLVHTWCGSNPWKLASGWSSACPCTPCWTHTPCQPRALRARERPLLKRYLICPIVCVPPIMDPKINCIKGWKTMG